MASDAWFAVKRSKESSVVYLMTGGDRRMVEATANSMFRAPLIQKITWNILKQLTGCHIPGDRAGTDYARGQFLIPCLVKHDIVIVAL